MKIGILTFHFAHNFGAMAQAYALCSYLNSIGHKCKIIDYRPGFMYGYLDNTTNSIYSYYYKQLNEGSTKWKSIKKTLRFSPFIIRNQLFHKNQKQAEWIEYNSFMKKYMSLSRRIYTPNNFKLNKYDVIIVGSDQIWNNELTNDSDLIYFLNINGDFKRIAYAASSGYEYIPNLENNKRYIVGLLNKFDAISCREILLSNYVSGLIGKSIFTVCDPVFLLEKWQWLRLIQNKPLIEYSYILIHDIHNDKICSEIAKKFSLKYNLKIVSTGLKPTDPQLDYLEMKVGPLSFLNLINNAVFVASNSFHAICLSLILNKQLIPISPKIRVERVINLMNILKISDYLVNSEFPTKDIIPISEFDNLNTQINLFRENSISFLNESINH